MSETESEEKEVSLRPRGTIISINKEIAEIKLEQTGEIVYIPLFLLEDI